MNGLVSHASGPLLEVLPMVDALFPRVETDTVQLLLDGYARERHTLGVVKQFFDTQDTQEALRYFLAAANGRHTVFLDLDLEKAIAEIDAVYWNRAVLLGQIWETLPAPRRNEWRDALEKRKCPAFQEATVWATLRELLASRARFFAERVDGVWTALSRGHKTNPRNGFYQRMILAGVMNEWGSVNPYRGDAIHDLRYVVHKLLLRAREPFRGSTAKALQVAWSEGRRGQWLELDGGALRVRCYGIGTAHLEVHPDIAERLNSILAALHPHAIAGERQDPPRKPKAFTLLRTPLPLPVLEVLERMYITHQEASWGYEGKPGDKHLSRAVGEVLEGLGGVPTLAGWKFDYPAQEAIDFVLATGEVPDDVSHQFYPTPEGMAEELVRWAGIGREDECLEPSAGTGALAGFMPEDRTLCVEVDPLRCRVLRSKGLRVEEADFLAWSSQRFDVIVMNPPFSQGRALAHFVKAAGSLRPGGRVVAILPASLRGKLNPVGVTMEYGRDGRFPGTSIDVVMVKGVAA